MDEYPYPISGTQADSWTADRNDAVTEYLGAQVPPITVEAIRIEWMQTGAVLVIRASADPRPALNAWAPGDSTARQGVLQAAAFLNTYQDIVRAWDATTGPAPTQAQVAHAAAANWVVLKALAKRSGVM